MTDFTLTSSYTTETDVRQCIACNGRNLRRFFDVRICDGYQIDQCLSCGLAFASPRPTVGELEKFYTSGYFARELPISLGYANYRDVAETNARRMWHTLKKDLGNKVPSSKRVLDVGCATGGFLSEAQLDGWVAVGVEVSEYAGRIAREEFDLTVHQGDIFSPEICGTHFGMVTMWHVLEHMIDPCAAIRKAFELLEPGGILFVELPNWDSCGRRVKGVRWSQLKPPEHINFFNLKSLAAAVRSAGFSVEFCRSDYPSVFDQVAVKRPTRFFYVLKAMLARFACQLGWGGYVRLAAQKRNN